MRGKEGLQGPGTGLKRKLYRDEDNSGRGGREEPYSGQPGYLKLTLPSIILGPGSLNV